MPEASLELVSIRLTAIGETDKPHFPQQKRQPSSSEHALSGERQVYLTDRGTFGAVPVYNGDRLAYGNRVNGPAIIEQVTTTIFVPTEYEVICDVLGSFTMFLKDRAGEFETRLAEQTLVTS